MEHSHDALILGRGLAGSVLAETLLQRGLRVHVFDQVRPNSASRVAAGAVNPVALRRDIATWRTAELLPSAAEFFALAPADLRSVVTSSPLISPTAPSASGPRALFRSAVLNTYLKQQDSARMATAYAAFRAHFHDAGIQANIRETKEEQYQEGFLCNLFVQVLKAAQWKVVVS